MYVPTYLLLWFCGADVLLWSAPICGRFLQRLLRSIINQAITQVKQAFNVAILACFTNRQAECSTGVVVLHTSESPVGNSFRVFGLVVVVVSHVDRLAGTRSLQPNPRACWIVEVQLRELADAWTMKRRLFLTLSRSRSAVEKTAAVFRIQKGYTEGPIGGVAECSRAADSHVISDQMGLIICLDLPFLMFRSLKRRITCRSTHEDTTCRSTVGSHHFPAVGPTVHDLRVAQNRGLWRGLTYKRGGLDMLPHSSN